jgi:hypothetical protein
MSFFSTVVNPNRFLSSHNTTFNCRLISDGVASAR